MTEIKFDDKCETLFVLLEWPDLCVFPSRVFMLNNTPYCLPSLKNSTKREIASRYKVIRWIDLETHYNRYRQIAIIRDASNFNQENGKWLNYSTAFEDMRQRFDNFEVYTSHYFVHFLHPVVKWLVNSASPAITGEPTVPDDAKCKVFFVLLKWERGPLVNFPRKIYLKTVTTRHGEAYYTLPVLENTTKEELSGQYKIAKWIELKTNDGIQLAAIVEDFSEITFTSGDWRDYSTTIDNMRKRLDSYGVYISSFMVTKVNTWVMNQIDH